MSQFVQVITRQELLEEAKKTKFYFFIKGIVESCQQSSADKTVLRVNELAALSRGTDSYGTISKICMEKGKMISTITVSDKKATEEFINANDAARYLSALFTADHMLLNDFFRAFTITGKLNDVEYIINDLRASLKE